MRPLPLLVLSFALATAACAHSPTLPSPERVRALTEPRQLVRVTNRGWNDVELSAVRGGTRRILCVIPAAQEATLMVSADMLDGDGRLQLAARVQGRRDVTLMQPVRVPQDNYIDWSLERDIGRSSVSYFPM